MDSRVIFRETVEAKTRAFLFQETRRILVFHRQVWNRIKVFVIIQGSSLLAVGVVVPQNGDMPCLFVVLRNLEIREGRPACADQTGDVRIL
jgi:hypothetical protein